MTTTKPWVNRSFWFTFHGWLSLPIWALLSVICISGTICVISQELTWLFNSETRANNPNNLPQLTFQDIGDKVKSQYPRSQLLSIHVDNSYQASRVKIRLPDNENKQLYINQYTGDIQGEKTGIGFREFMLALHGWLLLPWQGDYSIGWYIVTALSIPLLGSLITGLIIFKRFWRNLYRPKLRFNKNSRVAWGDWHRFAAVWSIPFIVIFSISGLWFLVSGVVEHNGGSIYTAPPSISSTFSHENTQPTTLNTLIKNTQNHYPDLNITSVMLPETQSEIVTVMGYRGFGLIRDTGNRVYLDSRTGNVISSHGFEDLTATEWLEVILVPLHFGDFAPLVSRLIWFVFGILLSSLVCSGLIIWSKRTVNAAQRLPKIIHSNTSLLWQKRLFNHNWLILLCIIVFALYSLSRLS